MPDSQRLSSPKIAPRPTWSAESLNSNSEQKTVIRKFINSAIYVEKSVMPPLRKKSALVPNSFSDGEYTTRTTSSDRSVKRCTCISAHKKCPCHAGEGARRYARSELSSEESSTNTDESQVTVRSKQITPSEIGTDLRLHLDSGSARNLDPREKQEMIREWLRKKDEEKRKRDREEARHKEAKAKEREQLLERERENFRKWLADKKTQEDSARKESHKKEEENKTKETMKQQKVKENQEMYYAWLKKKKRADLERKIKEKLALLQVYEEKQRRMEENEQAFSQWLKTSKNKPRPLPLNQGLKSLCSSASVTYINPVPWIPNVEMPQKPTSQ